MVSAFCFNITAHSFCFWGEQEQGPAQTAQKRTQSWVQALQQDSREGGREFERQMVGCAGISEEASVSYRLALSTVKVGGQWGLGL